MSAGPAVTTPFPMRTKMPVPMMAPTPRAVSWIGPSTRLSRFSPLASSRMSDRGFRANRGFGMGIDTTGARPGKASGFLRGCGGELADRELHGASAAPGGDPGREGAVDVGPRPGVALAETERDGAAHRAAAILEDEPEVRAVADLAAVADPEAAADQHRLLVALAERGQAAE